MLYCPHCGSATIDGRCHVCGVVPDGPQPAAGKSAYATWGQRVAATLIDDLVVLGPTLAIAVIPAPLWASIIVTQLLIIGYLVYFLTKPAGQTIGNRVAHTYVRDETTNRAPSARAVIIRWLFSFVIGLAYVALPHVPLVVLLIAIVDDVIFPLTDKHRRTLHDIAAGTAVLREPTS